MILLLMHVLLLPKVLLLLINRLSYDPLSVEIRGQVLEALDFEFENFCAIEIFVVYGELFLNFKLHELRPS